MKVKFVWVKKPGVNTCKKCCYAFDFCAGKCFDRKDGKKGYFVAIKRKPHTSKYERLLKALLKRLAIGTMNDGEKFLIQPIGASLIPSSMKKIERELIKIKESMK